VTYTAVALLFALICIGVGARAGLGSARPLVTALLAGAMVLAQFALLIPR
jgi:hypothetical protein